MPHSTPSGNETARRVHPSSLPILGLFQAVGIALLPKCPLCLASYLGAFGSLGLLTNASSNTLIFVTAVSMLMGLFVFGYFAFINQNLWILALGIFSTSLILTGKYYFVSQGAVFMGVAVFSVASILNVALARNRRALPRVRKAKLPSPCGCK